MYRTGLSGYYNGVPKVLRLLINTLNIKIKAKSIFLQIFKMLNSDELAMPDNTVNTINNKQLLLIKTVTILHNNF